MQARINNLVFTQQGLKWYDFWLVNGQTNFAVIPPNIIPADNIEGFDSSCAVPIRLQNGKKPSFGYEHILFKHGNWAKKLASSIPELIYIKLGQSGDIYLTEHKKKVKILLRVSPSALMVLNYIENGHFFSVITLYDQRNSQLDGDKIGRYLGNYQCKFTNETK
jgi:hypothetical protein